MANETESQAHLNFSSLKDVAIILLVPSLIICLQKLAASAQLGTINTPNETTKSNERSSAHHHRRRTQHAITGLSFYILSYLIPRTLSTILLSLSTTLLCVLNFARSFSPKLQSHYLNNFGPLLRTHELRPGVLPGAFWFLAGVTMTSIFIQDLDMARVGLLCLALADPVAAGVGLYFPDSSLAFEVSCWGPIRLARSLKDGVAGERDKKGALVGSRKSLAGCVACFLVSLFVAQASALTRQEHDNESRGWDWDASMAAALTTTVMEGFLSSFIGIDDNFLIPIGTSLALSWYHNS